MVTAGNKAKHCWLVIHATKKIYHDHHHHHHYHQQQHSIFRMS